TTLGSPPLPRQDNEDDLLGRHRRRRQQCKEHQRDRGSFHLGVSLRFPAWAAIRYNAAPTARAKPPSRSCGPVAPNRIDSAMTIAAIGITGPSGTRIVGAAT